MPPRLSGDVVEFDKISLLNGSHDGGGVIEAMVVLEMVVVVELRSPLICRMRAAYGVCGVPVGFSDEVSIAFAVDNGQVCAGWIVNVDFGATA